MGISGEALKGLDLTGLRNAYASGDFTPFDLVELVTERRQRSNDPAIFITPADRGCLRRQAEALIGRTPAPNSLPLWGIPFAVKDNIDVSGFPTTAACPAFAYLPARDASVVARLREAGAIVTGKTNLDQFATGLNGTRSPHGAPRSVFDPTFVSGGSSSGSAVAVAAGLATFSLGTDTAGSGRIPAAFNNLVGIKPTPGLLSTAGVVPACRSLDCVTIFANTVLDGIAVRRLAEGFDEADPFSRRPEPRALPRTELRVGILAGADREFFGDGETERLYDEAVGRMHALGASVVPFDYAPFRDAAALLYEGPWVAERLAAIEPFLSAHPDSIDPNVKSIIEGAHRFSAVDAFRGRYQLEALRRRTEAEWAKADVLLLPTAPTTYTVAEMLADPIRLNARLGLYTNFANLLDCSAIAIPAGFRADGLPAGVTLVGRAFYDDALAQLADALHRSANAGMGAQTGATLPAPTAKPDTEWPGALISLVVVGAHLRGMALNGDLLDLGARFVKTSRTNGDYRLFALSGTTPPKPGLIRAPGFAGDGVEVEVWQMDPAAFGRLVESIPAPLGIGKIDLSDGSQVSGFLCEACAVEGAKDITAFGGWRAYAAERPGGPF